MRERLAKKLLRVTLECTRDRLEDQGRNHPPVDDKIVDMHWDWPSGEFRDEAFKLADCAIKELSN